MRGRDIVAHSLYFGLFGITAATGLASWIAASRPTSASIALQVGCILAAGSIVLLLDQLSQQSCGLPNIVAALAVVGAMVGTQVALHVPFSHLILYAASGFIIGGVVGASATITGTITLLVPLAAIVGTGFAGLHAWNESQLASVTMWQGVITSAISALALSSLAPTRDIASSGYICASSLLFAGIWFWPLTDLAHYDSSWRIPTGVFIFEGVGGALFLVLAWRFVGHLWLVPSMVRRLFVRQLAQVLKRFSPNRLFAFQKTYANADSTWRTAMLKEMVSIDTLDGWAHVVEHQETKFGEDALNVLGEIAKTAQLKLRAALLRLFYNGIQQEKTQVWQACLDKLIQLDQKTALEACRKRLDTNELGPMRHFLKVADLSQYTAELSALADAAKSVPTSVRGEIVDYIQREAQDRHPERAAVAIVALVRLKLSARIWKRLHKHLRRFLKVAGLSQYTDVLSALVDAAASAPTSVRAEIIKCIQQEARGRHPERSAVAIAALVELKPSALLSLYADQQQDRVAAWQIALANDASSLSDLMRESLLNHMAPHWDAACDLASRVASLLDKNASPAERQGLNQMRAILATVIWAGDVPVRKKTAHILAQVAPDTNWRMLAAALSVEHLKNLYDLLNDDQPTVRQMTHKTLKEVLSRHPESRRRVVTMLSQTFRTAKAEAASESLHHLATLDPLLTGIEALWAAKQGTEQHIRLLLELIDDLAYTSAVASFVGAYQSEALSNRRAMQIWSWLQKLRPAAPLSHVAVALNGLALIDLERTLKQLQDHPNDWPVAAIRMALGRPSSPLCSLLWQWVESTDSVRSAQGVALLDQIVSP